MTTKTKLIKVRATEANGVRVFQEADPNHPNGEVDIWGNEGVHTVALTPAIEGLLAAGVLTQIDAPELEEVEPPKPEPRMGMEPSDVEPPKETKKPAKGAKVEEEK